MTAREKQQTVKNKRNVLTERRHDTDKHTQAHTPTHPPPPHTHTTITATTTTKTETNNSKTNKQKQKPNEHFANICLHRE